MSQYLLSTFAVGGEVPGAPMTPDDMQTFMQRVIALEADMDASDSFVFGGALQGPDEATVVRPADGGEAMAEGPFIDSEGHLAGFYIINADDLEAALSWARKVSAATNHPIEVRPFFATGRLADQLPDMPGA